MKIASLLAGAAAVSLMAAPALAGPDIYQGSFYASPLVNGSGSLAGSGLGNTLGLGGLIVADALPANNTVDSGVAVFTIESDGFDNNSGTANATPGAVLFSLTGNVTPDCAFYNTNAANRTVAFGQIGIDANDNNPTEAFELVGAAPQVDIETNLAGCNTRSRVTVTKANLKNAAAAGLGFDTVQFTDEIQFTALGNYTAGPVGSPTAVQANHIDIAAAATSDIAEHGAWKSAMRVRLQMIDPGKALVAGDYAGSVSVNIAAF